MSTKQKLELNWIGKHKRPRLEPRILLEDKSLSYGDADSENLLIHGDNLLALKALEQKYAGKVKCIYIDPPFNTGQAFELYDDGLEHSLWLTLMRQRLEILYSLLSEDGLFWIHLDDSEVHYLKVVLDEVFGREHFVSHISYERSSAAGIGQGGFIVDTSEHILLYKKSIISQHEIKNSIPLDLKTIKRYNKSLKSFKGKRLVREFISKSNGKPVRVYEYDEFEVQTISLKDYDKRKNEIDLALADNFETLFRTNQIQKENSFQRDLVDGMDKSKLYSVEYTPSRGKYQDQLTELFYLNAELFSWLKDTATLEPEGIVKHSNLTNFWRHEDIPKADIANEGGVKFPRGKKPEQLLKRIIEISTKPGDLVLDSFGGSGTTGATAHKLKRRWIMIELGEHCHTHIAPRLRKVVNGEDQGGISKSVDWKGGGGFRYLRLAPSLLKKDSWGNWVINKEYNAEMLAEAMCKHMNFTYAPSQTQYWNHGYSTEADYIYVTTGSLAYEQLKVISEEVGTERTLLICCKAFMTEGADFPNLTLVKIPRAILSKCEWDQDDYSFTLNVLSDTEQPDDIEYDEDTEGEELL
ncbi:TPA: site-specific DNA-methyltransferase [Klebsiella variicola subsp. variicola]|nr:site-specific DNA-methyltransferase [Klebsiella variicola subsp. variicola]HBQ6256964.1 site-specific DNA-methyltransferase [Klebsiella variicola subsp. variicola]HBQ6647484.1 site-specific DNA-methyltransferase [Klebsiella variicola subsp. variicola]